MALATSRDGLWAGVAWGGLQCSQLGSELVAGQDAQLGQRPQRTLGRLASRDDLVNLPRGAFCGLASLHGLSGRSFGVQALVAGAHGLPALIGGVAPQGERRAIAQNGRDVAKGDGVAVVVGDPLAPRIRDLIRGHIGVERGQIESRASDADVVVEFGHGVGGVGHVGVPLIVWCFGVCVFPMIRE